MTGQKTRAARPPTRRTAPPPARKPAPAGGIADPLAAGTATLAFEPIAAAHGKRIGLYGPGGVGKTSLALLAAGPIAYFDLEGTLPDLRDQVEQGELDIRPVSNVAGWEDLRKSINAQESGWEGIKTVVIDSATLTEEWALKYTLATVPHEKGHLVSRIEDYGYGKGYAHLYEVWLPVLSDLERHIRAGRNVVMLMHDCTTPVPNPLGEDYIRWEPRLQTTNKGAASIRLRVREWLAYLFYIGYDLDVKKGKAEGEGTRSVYTCEKAHCMAKRRPLFEVEGVESLDMIPYIHCYDTTVWQAVFGEDA
ncbi:MAG: AAA family ATPase [Planctomycetes bacterium]|nr:AAA family ATPase [Planctomycetota bacterium]